MVCSHKLLESLGAMTENYDNLKLLVIDDESFVLSLSVRILNKLGYENIDTANNGVEALEKLDKSQAPYDVIICDLNMPEMNGVEFMYHAQQKKFSGGLILLSGEDKRILETAMGLALEKNLNVLGVLPKPVSPVSLGDLLITYKPTVSKKSDVDRDQAISKTEMVEGLKSEEGGLDLFYQPIAHIRSGEIAGVQTIVRWKHVSRGLLDPKTFMPLAEQLGLIDELTARVYSKAAKQSSEWLSSKIYLENSINVSTSFLSDPDLIEFILNEPGEMGVDPKYLILQIPERQLLTEFHSSSDLMMRLRFKKLGISIGNFSMSDAAMGLIKSMPFTQLKVNWGSIEAAGRNSEIESDTSNKIALAQELGMQITATGVQSRGDWDYAEKLGFDSVQGVFCSKPLSSEGLLDFIKRWRPPPRRN